MAKYRLLKEGLENYLAETTDDIQIERDDFGTYSVEYYKVINGKTIELSGKLVGKYTGRDTDYKFEPSWFSDDISEKYYEENWEDIEEEILNKFNTASLNK